jgi:hypothetical protein
MVVMLADLLHMALIIMVELLEMVLVEVVVTAQCKLLLAMVEAEEAQEAQVQLGIQVKMEVLELIL